jgi:hypothetical protein
VVTAVAGGGQLVVGRGLLLEGAQRQQRRALGVSDTGQAP